MTGPEARDTERWGVDHWAGPEFRARAAAWVRTVCDRLDIEVLGDPEQPHNRPWSSALRFASDDGPLWFKVNGPGTRHEAALVRVLADLAPDLVPELLATDRDRGWSLTRDAGPTMRSTAPAHELWSSWEELLPRYAAAQLTLADHRASLLGAGMREMGPAQLPTRLVRLVEELAALGPAEDGLGRDEAGALSDLLPEYEVWCAELAGSGIPESVQHDDLHSNNVCWTGSTTTARIIDWGDAVVGHPLATMLCTLNSVAHHAGAELDDPRVLRVRDAYLEPFTGYADRDALRHYVDLARRTGCLTRALSWRSALVGSSRDTRAELGWPVRGWLLELLED